MSLMAWPPTEKTLIRERHPPTAPLRIPEREWSTGMRQIFDYTQGVAQRLIDKSLMIRFVHWPRRDGGSWRACYGAGHLLGVSSFDYNVGVLGRRWFENGVTEDVDSLILHELGHEFCTNHADEDYYRALTKLGARLKAAALAMPSRIYDQTQRILTQVSGRGTRTLGCSC